MKNYADRRRKAILTILHNYQTRTDPKHPLDCPSGFLASRKSNSGAGRTKHVRRGSLRRSLKTLSGGYRSAELIDNFLLSQSSDKEEVPEPMIAIRRVMSEPRSAGGPTRSSQQPEGHSIRATRETPTKDRSRWSRWNATRVILCRKNKSPLSNLRFARKKYQVANDFRPLFKTTKRWAPNFVISLRASAGQSTSGTADAEISAKREPDRTKLAFRSGRRDGQREIGASSAAGHREVNHRRTGNKTGPQSKCPTLKMAASRLP